MKIAVCDSRIPCAAKKNLYEYCDRIILLPPFSALDAPVSAHPDMLIFPVADEKMIYTHGEYLAECRMAFEGSGYDVIPIAEKASRKYPYDILLNAAHVGNHIFGRAEYISSSILSYASEKGIEIIDINQGYAKCSICKASENAIISSDPSVLAAAEKLKLDTLKIDECGVSLDGYNHGFIGGASGYDGENVFFCGDINKHSDGERIADFCVSHGKRAVSLSDEALYDIGTIFFI